MFFNIFEKKQTQFVFILIAFIFKKKLREKHYHSPTPLLRENQKCHPASKNSSKTVEVRAPERERGNRAYKSEMAISGDLRVSATLASYSKHPPRLCSLPPSNSKVSTPSFNLALLASVFTCILYYSSHVMSIYLCWLGNLRNALGDEMGKIGVLG